MKSLVCIKPGEWQYQEIEKPTVAAGEVILKIRRIGICGTDLHAFQGNQPFFSYPRILGHEFAGEITELADDVTEFKIGDKVTTIPYVSCGICVACRRGSTNCCTDIQVLGVHTDGAMKDYMAVSASLLIKVDTLSLEETALIECLSIGAHAVRRGNIQKDENVVIAGAGPIGLSVLQFAKAAGSKITMIDINNDRLKYCRDEFGVNTVNPLECKPEDSISELTNGDFADVVIDATGNAAAMKQAIQYCAHSGRLVYVGLNKGEISFLHPEIHKRELTILCSRNATKEDFQKVIDCLEDGSVKSACMITHTSSFDDLTSNFTEWLKPETGVIKAMINMDEVSK
jgi:2-desacetyl-2-hydroxyethyl bacteriochlorophyllide A dehydrogenase